MNKIKLNILGTVILLGVSALSLTACGNNLVAAAGEEFKLLTLDDLRASSSQENPLEVIYWDSFSSPYDAEVDNLVENFEDVMADEGIYIDVKVTHLSGGYDAIRASVNMGASRGAVPTLCLGYPDHFSDYIANDILLPLDEFVNASDPNIGMSGDYSADDFVESYWDEVLMNDNNGDEIIAGIPFNKSTEVMYYNASVVDPILVEEGIIEKVGDPWSQPTWDDVAKVSANIANKIKASGSIEWTYQGVKQKSSTVNYPTYIDSPSNFFITAVKQFCKTAEEANNVYTSKDGKAVFLNNTAVEAMQWFYNKSLEGREGTNPEDIWGLWNLPDAVAGGGSYGSDYMTLNRAFISIGSTAGVKHNASKNYDMKCAPIPQMSHDNNFNAVIQQGTNIAILKPNSNNLTRLAAWLLIRYMTNTENTMNFSINTGYMPVRESALNSETYQAFLADENDVFTGITARALIAANSQKNIFYTDPAFVGSSIIRDEVEEMVKKIFTENGDIVECMRDSYEQLKRYRIETVDSYTK